MNKFTKIPLLHASPSRFVMYFPATTVYQHQLVLAEQLQPVLGVRGDEG